MIFPAIFAVFSVTDMVHDGHLRCQAMMRVVISGCLSILKITGDIGSTNPGDYNLSVAL